MANEQRPEIQAIALTCATIAEKLELERDFEEPLAMWADREKFVEARQPGLITKELVRSLPMLEHIRGRKIGVLYTKTSFAVQGKPAIGKCHRPSGLLRQYSGRDWIFVYSHEDWLILTTMQRVALVFHELLHAAIDVEKGTPMVLPHDFEGFFVELEVFGTDLFRTWRLLREVAERAPREQTELELEDVVLKTEELAGAAG